MVREQYISSTTKFLTGCPAEANMDNNVIREKVSEDREILVYLANVSSASFLTRTSGLSVKVFAFNKDTTVI